MQNYRFFLSLSLLALAGCSAATTTTASPALALGNWQITSASTKLPSISGELSGSSAALTGIFHSNSSSSCIAPNSSFALTGSISGTNVTLTSASLGLTLTGTLAADGKSLTNATYNVTGGTCAFAAPISAQAQSFSPITGTYTGTFTDATNTPLIAITAPLTQTPSSDPNGNFQLSGSASFGANPCFTSPVAIASSQVTGGSFALTYADSVTKNSVTASGTFSNDGTKLAVTNWVLSGPCGPDSGTGSLSR